MNIFAFMCSAFMLGCLCGLKVAAVKIAAFSAAFVFVFLLKLIFFRFKKTDNLWVFAIFVTFALGAVLGIVYDRHCFAKVNGLFGTEVTLSGIVTESSGKSFVMDVGEYSVAVYGFNDNLDVEADEIVTVNGVLEGYPIAGFRGDIDQRLYYALKGIYGKIASKSITRQGYRESFTVQKAGNAVRSRIIKRIAESRRYGNEGFITALLTGETDLLDNDTTEKFRLSGMSHLVAVSGLHLGIFLSFFAFITRGFRKNRAAQAVIMLIIAGLYVIMVGDRASIMRAAIMFATGLFMTSSRHRSDPVTNLMLAGIIICFINPYYMADAGFQMSFLATLGILLFAGFFKRQTIAVPVIATLFLFPVTSYYYNMVPLLGILANIISVAAVPFIIVFGYLGCIFLPLASVAELFASFVINVADIFSSIDFLRISIPSPGIFAMLLFFLAVCFAYFLLDGFRIDEAFTTAGIALVAAALFIVPSVARDKDYAEVNFINSGNYNMLHIADKKSGNIFIDCGYKAPQYVQKNGIDEIAAIIVTENRASKYSGLEKICQTANVGSVILPKSMKDKDLKLEKTRILYYNQDNYSSGDGSIKLKSVRENGSIRFMVSVNKKLIMIPINTRSISELGVCNVICVPKACSDCAEYAKKDNAEYFIQAVYECEKYEWGNKYITARDGMISMRFYEDYAFSIHY